MRRLNALLLACTAATAPLAAQAPDRIFLNAKIWTGDSTRPTAEAIAVRGDRIVALGSSKALRRLAGPATEQIDLRGRRVLPGLIDAHWHFIVLNKANLGGAGSLAEIQRRLVAFASAHPDAAWVQGSGWVYTDFPNLKPHRAQLDSIIPDRPVFISDRDLHVGIANTRALALAGITRETPDPAGGRIIRDAAGEPTGELQESAKQLVQRLIPAPTRAEYAAGLRQLMDSAAKYGLTSLHNVSGWQSADEQAAFEETLAAGALKQRFYVAVPLRPTVTDSALRAYAALREKHRGPLLKYGSAKGFVDGTIDAKTAVMLEPFVGGGNGIAEYTQAQLNALVSRYDSAGFQILLHAIGDGGVRMALDAYRQLAETRGVRDRRPRIEHLETVALADLPRFRAQGVIASMQALFATPDPSTLGNYSQNLGPERASRANGFKLLEDAGATIAFGSDYSVYPMDPLLGIYVAATRMTAAGTPAGGWYPANRITVASAVRHFTRDAAYASFDEAEKGQLTVGRLADFVVLSDDIFALPPEQLLRAKVVRTVMGGRDTYLREP